MSSRIRKALFIIILAVCLSNVPAGRHPGSASASIDRSIDTTEWTPRRRVILMIGDGMGAVQRQAGQWSKVGLTGTSAMDSLPVSGWVQTANVTGGVTDSAAAATAMATGSKTLNGYLGVDRTGATLNIDFGPGAGAGIADRPGRDQPDHECHPRGIRRAHQ